ncbi:MAG: sigma-70 family RNA polymerase sigma factor [Lachnospiraceae bacterium]|nr:sigma-70 family RNA polymerase sigma factor [Lachnospiraceae bacterium]
MTGKELEKIYNEAYKAVYWTAMALLKNEADAEDIVQDTFISFMESYSDLKDTGKATALLKKIAANKCLNRIKLAKTDNMDDEFFESVEAVPEDFLPDTIVESDEMRKVVMDIIEKSLSDDVRRTLILFYFDEMSTKEIAEALGIPQGTVLWRLNFAKKKIKKEVEKYEDENNTKLFGMAALPFLSKLFIKEAEQVEFKPMPASFANLSASAESQIAKEAVKKGTEGMLKKIVIGSIAAATAGIVFLLGNKLNPNTYPTETAVSTESETTTTTEQETTAAEETTEELTTTTTEETTSEETTTEETTSETTTKAPTKAASKKSSVPTVPKGWVKIKGCWGKKVNGRKVYAIAKKPGVSTWTFKGWYNGKWVKLYEDDYSSDPEGAITTIDFYLDKNLKKFYCRYVD